MPDERPSQRVAEALDTFEGELRELETVNILLDERVREAAIRAVWATGPIIEEAEASEVLKDLVVRDIASSIPSLRKGAVREALNRTIQQSRRADENGGGPRG